jgi:hypothetical protein
MRRADRVTSRQVGVQVPAGVSGLYRNHAREQDPDRAPPAESANALMGCFVGYWVQIPGRRFAGLAGVVVEDGV